MQAFDQYYSHNGVHQCGQDSQLLESLAEVQQLENEVETAMDSLEHLTQLNVHELTAIEDIYEPAIQRCSMTNSQLRPIIRRAEVMAKATRVRLEKMLQSRYADGHGLMYYRGPRPGKKASFFQHDSDDSEEDDDRDEGEKFILKLADQIVHGPHADDDSELATITALAHAVIQDFTEIRALRQLKAAVHKLHMQLGAEFIAYGELPSTSRASALPLSGYSR